MNENKISRRQLKRMIYIEGFGAAGLTFPAVAAYDSRSEGLWPLLLYAGFLMLLVGWILFHVRHLEKVYTSKMKVGYGFVTGKWIGAIYIARFFLNGLALFYFFGLSIHNIYMPDASMFKILLPFAVLLWYCCQTTLQKRARFLEVLFPWVLVLFIILVVFAFLGVEGDFQVPSLREDGWVLLENGYLLLLCATPLEFLLFLVPATTENLWENRYFSRDITSGIIKEENELSESMSTKNTERENGISTKNEAEGSMVSEDMLMKELSEENRSTGDSWWRERRNLVWKSVAGVGIWNVLLWFVTVQNLGGALTASTPWPVIKVMQLIRLPGGFLERFDILLAIFWVFCMVGVLSGYLFYGRKIGEEAFGKKISDSQTLRIWTAVFTAGVILVMLLCGSFLSEEEGKKLMCGFLFYKKWIDFPLLLLLPLCSWFFPSGTVSLSDSYSKKQSGFSQKKQFDFSLKRQSGFFLKKKSEFFSKKREKVRATIVAMFFLLIITLCGCGKQEDVEDKSYVLSLYVDVREDDYEYWIFKANLGEMEAREERIPCDMIYFAAENMEEMEEKYEKSETGALEWNHVETIFLGTDLAENEGKLDSFLREWEADWQKNPDVLLVVYPQSVGELKNIEDIPEGSVGQEVKKLVEQEERSEDNAGHRSKELTEREKQSVDDSNEEVSGGYCRTPIEVLKAEAAGKENLVLHQVRVGVGRLIFSKGYQIYKN